MHCGISCQRNTNMCKTQESTQESTQVLLPCKIQIPASFLLLGKTWQIEDCLQVCTYLSIFLKKFQASLYNHFSNWQTFIWLLFVQTYICSFNIWIRNKGAGREIKRGKQCNVSSWIHLSAWKETLSGPAPCAVHSKMGRRLQVNLPILSKHKMPSVCFYSPSNFSLLSSTTAVP